MICVSMSLIFLITCLFSDFRFILPVLFDRFVFSLLEFSVVKLALNVFIANVFKYVLCVVCVLCECFCFTGVVISFLLFLEIVLRLWINNWWLYYLTVFLRKCLLMY